MTENQTPVDHNGQPLGPDAGSQTANNIQLDPNMVAEILQRKFAMLTAQVTHENAVLEAGIETVTAKYNDILAKYEALQKAMADDATPTVS